MLALLHRTLRTREILRRMLIELADLGRSRRHIYGLRNSLEPFAERFPNLRRARQEDILAYLRSLQVGPRRRDNVRDAIVELSRFARRCEYIPETRSSAAEKIRRIKPLHDILTWTPAEARLLLEAVNTHWLPCVALGLFAGLRKSEILRLDWSAIKWEQGVISVPRKIARKSKVDRLVPIQPNLLTWLEPYRHRVGPLYPGSERSAENSCGYEMNRIRFRTGLLRRDNANRHSFGSYRLAVTQSYDRVALEMGNSVAKVKENYNDPKTEAEGLEYFGICRQSGAVVIPLALEFRTSPK